jgi:hypothetical protein
LCRGDIAPLTFAPMVKSFLRVPIVALLLGYSGFVLSQRVVIETDVPDVQLLRESSPRVVAKSDSQGRIEVFFNSGVRRNDLKFVLKKSGYNDSFITLKRKFHFGLEGVVYGAVGGLIGGAYLVYDDEFLSAISQNQQPAQYSAATRAGIGILGGGLVGFVYGMVMDGESNRWEVHPDTRAMKVKMVRSTESLQEEWAHLVSNHSFDEGIVFRNENPMFIPPGKPMEEELIAILEYRTQLRLDSIGGATCEQLLSKAFAVLEDEQNMTRKITGCRSCSTFNEDRAIFRTNLQEICLTNSTAELSKLHRSGYPSGVQMKMFTTRVRELVESNAGNFDRLLQEFSSEQLSQIATSDFITDRLAEKAFQTWLAQTKSGSAVEQRRQLLEDFQKLTQPFLALLNERDLSVLQQEQAERINYYFRDSLMNCEYFNLLTDELLHAISVGEIVPEGISVNSTLQVALEVFDKEVNSSNALMALVRTSAEYACRNHEFPRDKIPAIWLKALINNGFIETSVIDDAGNLGSGEFFEYVKSGIPSGLTGITLPKSRNDKFEGLEFDFSGKRLRWNATRFKAGNQVLVPSARAWCISFINESNKLEASVLCSTNVNNRFEYRPFIVRKGANFSFLVDNGLEARIKGLLSVNYKGMKSSDELYELLSELENAMDSLNDYRRLWDDCKTCIEGEMSAGEGSNSLLSDAIEGEYSKVRAAVTAQYDLVLQKEERAQAELDRKAEAARRKEMEKKRKYLGMHTIDSFHTVNLMDDEYSIWQGSYYCRGTGKWTVEGDKVVLHPNNSSCESVRNVAGSWPGFMFLR